MKKTTDNIFSTKEAGLNSSTGLQKVLFITKNNIVNTYNLNYNKKIKNDDILLIKKQGNEDNKFLLRNKNQLINFIEITKYIILLNFFNNIFVNNKISLFDNNSYNITLRIKGIDHKKIFSCDSNFPINSYPDKVYINGYQQDNVNYSYNLNQTNNFIELIWYNLISNCQNMFFQCSDITEIDLSNFNTSKVNNMIGMFNGCSSLTSLNLSYFDTRCRKDERYVLWL